MQDGEYGVIVEMTNRHHIDCWRKLVSDRQIELREQVDVTDLVGIEIAHGILVDGGRIDQLVG